MRRYYKPYGAAEMPFRPLRSHFFRPAIWPFLRQSSGSRWMTDALWLSPTQSVGLAVLLSTNTRRMLVNWFGIRYSTKLLSLGLRRDTRSFSIDPAHTSPFLSASTS